jgi:hypothetical protein
MVAAVAHEMEFEGKRQPNCTHDQCRRRVNKKQKN